MRISSGIRWYAFIRYYRSVLLGELALNIAMHTTFAASRKEPLAEVLERIHAALLAANLGEPQIQFVLADPQVGGRVSIVDRVLKRFPDLKRFERIRAPRNAAAGTKLITNITVSGTTEGSVDFTVLVEIARGVPRSFPFHNVTVHLSVPAFSAGTEISSVPGTPTPGVSVTDSWWVNGRNRNVTALTIVDADPTAKKLPKLPESVEAVLTACGRIKKTIQAPLVVVPAQQRPTIDSVAPEKAKAIRAVVQDFRTRMSEILERAALPHDLPPNREALLAARPATPAGPKKPELVRAFTPLGYDCSSESTGTFTLRRRTIGNLTAELRLDVGTWSNQIMALFLVLGLIDGIGFKATLILPVARQAVAGGQYPIGGPDTWRQIVDNLAALVAELDRSFVPAIEAISGPSPDWFRPESS
jgi:hypothetical protein